MKVSLDWLNQYINLPKTAPEKFAEVVAEHCFEVEKIISNQQDQYLFKGVVVAKVLDFEKHPNADRLRVVRLSTGREEIYPIVCGASNFKVGDNVALARPGAFIPHNIHSEAGESFTLGTAKIRGVESQGMICAGSELGLDDQDPDGVLILPKSATLGLDFADYLKSNNKDNKTDVVFDLALPANRPDLHSHLGVARELSAILGLERKKDFTEAEKLPGSKLKAKKLQVSIEDKKICPRYSAYKMEVKVGPSPDFIVERLKSLGLRSINNVVDITNYVMFEVGEPLHAFDSTKVNGSIKVRSAVKGEKIQTLDHKERVLEPGMLLISDQGGPLAIAGIMGGVDSEIKDTTIEIILEAATFNGSNIRSTSKKLSLRTDASALWEKGLAPEQSVIGAHHAIELLFKYADAKLIAFAEIGVDKTPQRVISFTAEDINKNLGTNFSASQISKYLKQTKLPISGSSKMTLKVPYYRQDMESYADIADEVLRIVGPNKIEKHPPVLARQRMQHDAAKQIFEIKEILARLGFTEVQTYSFVSRKNIEEVGYDPSTHVKVSNPLSADQDYLRKDLLISLLRTVSSNYRIDSDLSLFEVGKGYDGYLKENNEVGLARYSSELSPEFLISELKGAISNLIQVQASVQPQFNNVSDDELEVVVGDQRVGRIYAVSEPVTLKNFDLENPVIIAEVDIDRLSSLSESDGVQNKVYNPFSKYPERTLDISLIADKELSWSEIQRVVQGSSEGLIQNIQLFEAPHFYSEEELPDFHRNLLKDGRKNLAFHLVFQAFDRTLKDSEILPIYARIQERLVKELDTEIR
jgi:phenylalanyl-tRNA synthetase beta chain